MSSGGHDVGEQQAVERIEQGAAAFAKGDLPGALDAFSENIVWKVSGKSPLAGTYEGRDGLGRFFGATFDKTQGTITLELEKVLTNGDHSVHFIRLTATRDGQPYGITVANFGEHDPDGRTRRLWFLPDDQAALDRLFA